MKLALAGAGYRMWLASLPSVPWPSERMQVRELGCVGEGGREGGKEGGGEGGGRETQRENARECEEERVSERLRD